MAMKLPPNSNPVIAWVKQDCCSVVPVLAAYVREFEVACENLYEDYGYSYKEKEDTYYLKEGWYEVQNFSQMDGERFLTGFDEEVFYWAELPPFHDPVDNEFEDVEGRLDELSYRGIELDMSVGSLI